MRTKIIILAFMLSLIPATSNASRGTFKPPHASIIWHKQNMLKNKHTF